MINVHQRSTNIISHSRHKTARLEWRSNSLEDRNAWDDDWYTIPHPSTPRVWFSILTISPLLVADLADPALDNLINTIGRIQDRPWVPGITLLFIYFPKFLLALSFASESRPYCHNILEEYALRSLVLIHHYVSPARSAIYPSIHISISSQSMYAYSVYMPQICRQMMMMHVNEEHHASPETIPD